MDMRTLGNRAAALMAMFRNLHCRRSSRPYDGNSPHEDTSISSARGRLVRRRCRAVLVCIALWLSIASCSSDDSTNRLADVLADREVIADLRYESADDETQTDTSSQGMVAFGVDEFVSALVALEGGAPTWLAIPELSNEDGSNSIGGDDEVVEDMLSRFLPPELGENDRRYVWSLYWVLSMPPEKVQLEILNREFTGQDRFDWDFEGFRTRYPQYLEELAHSWLEINEDLQPSGLRIE